MPQCELILVVLFMLFYCIRVSNTGGLLAFIQNISINGTILSIRIGSSAYLQRSTFLGKKKKNRNETVPKKNLPSSDIDTVIQASTQAPY